MFSAIAFLQEKRLLAQKWTSPRPARERLHLVIVCANAEQRCPSVFPGMVERLFRPSEDPAARVDSEQAQREAFRRVRDQNDARLRGWLSEIGAQGSATR